MFQDTILMLYFMGNRLGSVRIGKNAGLAPFEPRNLVHASKKLSARPVDQPRINHGHRRVSPMRRRHEQFLQKLVAIVGLKR